MVRRLVPPPFSQPTDDRGDPGFAAKGAEGHGLRARARSEGAAEQDQLLLLLYDELRRLAAFYLRRERGDHTLQPTALVNEAYLKLSDRVGLTHTDREHFLALGAQAMRHVLVDHARRRNRGRRGGGAWRRVTLDEPLTPGGPEQAHGLDLVELDDLLARLAERDERAARVVELRFFGGLSIDETARVLGVSSGTVDNDWYAARAWLRREFAAGDAL